MNDLHHLKEREIGRVTGERPGPTLVTVAAIHGNEPGGIEAARRVLELLARPEVRLRGELVALAGNVGAMREGRRYRLRDMNRVWSESRVADLEKKAESELDVEDREQLDLLAAVRAAIEGARGPVHLIDLHTTSAAGVPFALFGDTLAQRRFAGALPLPLVMGLEEQVDGVLSEYWTRQGCVTFAVEGGKHDDPGSVDNLEAALLLGAAAAGLFPPDVLIRETQAARALLEAKRGSLPRVMEVVSRHAIGPEDKFVMEPGFKNLDFARAGQLLARDRHGEIRAPRDGLVILPLYQGQGSDGFFWGRPVSSARLRASEALRHMHVDRLFDLLPGVARDPTHPSRFILESSVAGLYPRDVFHLLGYRRIRKRTDQLTVERQPE